MNVNANFGQVYNMPSDLSDKMKNVVDIFKQDFQEKKFFSMDFVTNLMETNFYISK